MMPSAQRMASIAMIAMLALLCPAMPARAERVCIPLVGRAIYARPVTWGQVCHIVDGDTFDIDTDGDGLADDRVRPIGIDTPERGECYYREASARAEALLLGRLVALERDKSARDRYGRLLAYVYAPSGGWFNGIMVREGYARVAVYPPDVLYIPALQAQEAQAQAERAGGWGACGW